MNREFNNIIQRLQTNDKICVEIKQHPMGTVIVPNSDRIDHKKMTEQSGGVEEWFTALQNKGVGKIQIQLFRKHGNTCVREGLAYNCELGGEEKKEVMETPKQHSQHPTTEQPFGLGVPGLGMPEMINLHVDRNMLHLTKQDLETQKEKTVRLEKENRELEEQVRRLEKSNDTKEFWGNLVKEAGPALAGIVTSLKPPGLGSPSHDGFQLPQGLKGDLIKVIMNAPGLSDEQLIATYEVLSALANNQPNFKEELQQLLQQEKPIYNGTKHTH